MKCLNKSLYVREKIFSLKNNLRYMRDKTRLYRAAFMSIIGVGVGILWLSGIMKKMQVVEINIIEFGPKLANFLLDVLGIFSGA